MHSPVPSTKKPRASIRFRRSKSKKMLSLSCNNLQKNRKKLSWYYSQYKMSRWKTNRRMYRTPFKLKTRLMNRWYKWSHRLMSQ